MAFLHHKKPKNLFFEVLSSNNSFRSDIPLPIYPGIFQEVMTLVNNNVDSLDTTNSCKRFRGIQVKSCLVCPTDSPFLIVFLPQNYELVLSPIDLYIISLFYKVNLRSFDDLPEKYQKPECRKGYYSNGNQKDYRKSIFQKFRNFFRRFYIEDDPTNGVLILYLDQFAHRRNINEMLNFLIDRKDVDINSRDEYNKTALMKICEGKFDSDLALQIIERGANVHAFDKYNFTALHYAAATGKVDVVKKLLEKGANVTAKNCFNHCPLFLATYNSDRINLEVVNALMKNVPPEVPAIISYTTETTPGFFISTINCDYDADSKMTLDICFAFNCTYHSSEFGKNWNIDLFKVIWSRPNLNISKSICGAKFLDYFINFRHGRPQDSIKILKIILSSSVGPLLTEKYFHKFTEQYGFHPNFSIFRNWYKILTEVERIDLINWWYKVGGRVSIQDVNVLFELFGFKQEVRLLLKLIDSSFTSSSRSEYFYFNLFCGYESTFNASKLNSTCEISSRGTKFLLSNFTIPIEIFKRFNWNFDDEEFGFKNFIKATSSSSNVPPLMELCRNNIRIYIKNQYSLNYPQDFENIVEGLRIPKPLINYIMLRSD